MDGAESSRLVLALGNYQPLKQAVLDTPAPKVEVQPGLGLEPFGRGAGDQGHFFVSAAGSEGPSLASINVD